MRDYAAAREYERIKDASAFNIQGATCKRINQHLTLYIFADGSRLAIYPTRSQADAWHRDWLGSPDDIHLGPIRNAPLRINR